MLRECNCVICGKFFTTDNGRKITCSEECGITRRRRKQVEYHAEQRKKPKVQRKKTKSTLLNIQQKAREAGMSYGKYMAVMHGGMAVERGDTDEDAEL